jgi:hypothetical protein
MGGIRAECRAHRACAWLRWLPALLSAAVVAGATQTPELEDRLALGIRQARAGEFETAVETLNAVSRDLKERGGQARPLARAYAYLAICYLGMNHEQTAKAKLLEALEADRGLDLSPSEFPPRVVELFAEIVREERTRTGETATTPAVAPSPSPGNGTRGEKAGGAKRGLLIGGAAAAAAGVGIAAAGSGGSSPATVDDGDPCQGGFAFEADFAFSGSITCDLVNPRRQVYRVTNNANSPLRIDGLDARINYACEPAGTPAPPAETLPVLVLSVPPRTTAVIRNGSPEGTATVACCEVPGTCLAVQCTIMEEYTLRTGCGSRVLTHSFMESATGTGGPGDCLPCGTTRSWY